MSPHHNLHATHSADYGAMEDLDNPDLLPQVSDWLQELDHGPHGVNGHKFAQYSLVL